MDRRSITSKQYAKLAAKIIDLSADFRLSDAAVYEKWYGEKHAAPEWLGKFVYGLPELHRAELANANYISGVGCNATAGNLALLPLVKAGLMDLSAPVIIEIKVGSSESGAEGNIGIAACRAGKCDPDFFCVWAPPHGRGDSGNGCEGYLIDHDCCGFGARRAWRRLMQK